MSPINLHTLTDSVTDPNSEFKQKRFAILSLLEGKVPTPYFDSKGIITIGIGFNIDKVLENRNDVMAAMGLSSAQKASINAAWSSARMTEIKKMPHATEQQRNDKNAALVTYLNGILGVGQTFTMTDPQIKTVFDKLVVEHQDAISSLINKSSIEQIVLTSLHYNVATLIGKKLKAAFTLTDPAEARAEAWYQIRYAHDDQLHKRRYEEAALFGLYDNPSVAPSEKESLAVYRMFTQHRLEAIDSAANMIEYDKEYANDFKYGIPAANADLTKAGFGTYVVKTLFMELMPAAEVVMNKYIKDEYGVGHYFDPLNIQMASDKKFDLVGEDTVTRTGSDADLLIGRDEKDDILSGQGGNDLLIGLGGNDILYGGKGNDVMDGGAGNDIFYGGEGNDLIYGGAGHDTYYINTGDGTDTIEDKEGNNRVILNGKLISLLIEQAGGSYASPDGDLTAVMQGDNDLWVTDTASGQQVILNKDFQDGDFGIRLIKLPEVPEIPEASTSAPSVQGTNTEVGNAWINGGAGNDQMDGGAGDDVFSGGGGSDTIFAGGGNDDIFGDYEASSSTVSSNWTMVRSTYAGPNNITYYVHDSWPYLESVSGGAGDLIYGGAGDDWISGLKGDDVIYGEADNDVIWGDVSWYGLAHGAHGDDYIDGGTGEDHLYGDGGADTLLGGEGNDKLVGDNDDDDILDGGTGDDKLVGGNGDDILNGGADNDQLWGDNGDFTGNGNDKLYGDADDYHWRQAA